MQDLIDFRHELHQYPELSGAEYETAKRVKAFVNSFSSPVWVEHIGGYGMVAMYDFGIGPSVGFRCELDALPIQEQNKMSYASTDLGVSHKCGHDGHMTILVGLAQWISKQRFEGGKVYLIFQPAEETGKGAKQMLDDPKMKNIKLDYLFALHNIPGAKAHEVIIPEKQFSATVQSFRVHFEGKVAHAAFPEKGINPSSTIARLILALEELIVEDMDDSAFFLATPICTSIGQMDYGISAGRGEVHFTIRTWTVGHMRQMEIKILELLDKLVSNSGLTFSIKWFDYFPASINDTVCNEILRDSLEPSAMSYRFSKYAFRFGEDFGWFSDSYKTSMFGLGAGKKAYPLHHDLYDFNDALIETGVKIFSRIIKKVLCSDK